MSDRYASRSSAQGVDQSARRRAGVILAVVALAAGAGCSKSVANPDEPPVAPVATGTAPTSGATAGGSNAVPLAKLAGIVLPVPKGMPARGVWVDAPAPTGGSGDGDRDVNFTDGSDIWMGVRFLDCNLPVVRAAANKPDSERGDFGWCFDKPTGALKGFPLYRTNDEVRVVKPGHLIVIASMGEKGNEKHLKPAVLEEWLSGLNLTRIAKL